MRYSSVSLLDAALLLLGPSAVLSAAVHESIHSLPAGWKLDGTPSSDQKMSLQVGLTQQNLDELESKLYTASDPDSETYGAYMTKAEVNKIVMPKSESANKVVEWLKTSGAKDVATDGHWVKFTTTVGEANELFDTEFKNYKKDGEEGSKVRTMQYSIPEDLSEHVDLVDPTVFFGTLRAQLPTPVWKGEVDHGPYNGKGNGRGHGRGGRKGPGKSGHYPTAEEAQPTVPDSCGETITPDCAKALYNVGGYVPDESSGSFIGFGSFLNQSAQFSELFNYEDFFGLPMRNFSVELINGGEAPQNTEVDQVEANLDVQNIVGVTTGGLPIVEYSTGGSPPFIPDLTEPVLNQNEPYLPYYQYLLAQDDADLPQVITNSYGEDEQTIPDRYARRVCNMIGQLTARGISVLESSGDTGVGAPCISNDGQMTPKFNPIFPATCPFITAIGGTQSINPEVAWTNGSGGFSNLFPRPKYQDRFVRAYLRDGFAPGRFDELKQYFNEDGRGFPDISAHSLVPRYLIFTNGVSGGVGGTSAASPVVAGLIAMLNDARFKQGLPALGFLNPFLYKKGYKALYDITQGSIQGCTGVNSQTGEPYPDAAVIPGAEFNATRGWDAATGLGAPDFMALLDLVTKGGNGKGKGRGFGNGRGNGGGNGRGNGRGPPEA